MKVYFLISFLFLFSIKNYSQDNSKIDSLKVLLLNEKNDTLKVILLNNISWQYINSDIEQAYNYANRALKIAKKLNYKEGIASSLNRIAYTQSMQGDIESALININKAITIYELLNKPDKIAKSYLTVSQIYYEQSKYDKAIEYCNKSIKMKKKSKESGNLELNFLTLGAIYQHKGNYSKSLENFFKSLNYCKKNNNYLIMGSNYNNIAVIYRSQKKYNSAIEFYQKAIELHQKNGNKIGESQTVNNLAVVYEDEKYYDLALEYYNRALRISKEINYLQGIAMANTNIAGIEIQTGKTNNIKNKLIKAEKIFLQLEDKNNLTNVYKLLGQYYYKKGNFDLAIKYSEKAYKIAKKINVLDKQSKLAEQLSNLYERVYDYKLALKYNKIFKQTHDSLFNLQKSRLIEKMSNNYESLQKEKEIKEKNTTIKVLEKNKKISRLKMYILLSLVVLLIIISIFVYVVFKRKIKVTKHLMQKEESIRKLEIYNKRIEEDALNNEIAYKNKEIQNFASYIIDKNDFILKIQKELKNAKNRVDNIEIKQEIQNIISLINNKMLLEKDREEFLAYVDQINNNFYLKFKEKFKELSETELRIASLLRMGLSSKEISAILYITPKSVDTNRYRIRKKIGLSPDVNLIKFFREES